MSFLDDINQDEDYSIFPSEYTDSVSSKLNDVHHSLEVLLHAITSSCYPSGMELWKQSLGVQLSELTCLLQNEKLCLSDTEVLREINSLTKFIISICVERLYLKNNVEQFKIEAEQNKMKENNGTGDDPHSPDNNSEKRKSEDSSVSDTFSVNWEPKRLTDNQRFHLNQWFQENEANPYLKTNDLQKLSKRTGLTNVQIRNWAANKRRKVKTRGISKELKPLLK